jgi:hypothetical protein
MTNLKPPESNARDIDQAVWTVARRLGTFSVAQLISEAHVCQDTAEALTRAWLRSGIIEQSGTGDFGRRLFTAADGLDDLPVRQGLQSGPMSAEQAMWIAIRRCGTFTEVDVFSLANTDDNPISLRQVRGYFSTLLAAGYLRHGRKSLNKAALQTYRLINNSGPLAPTTRRVTITVDFNLNAVMHVPQVAK